MRSKAAPAFFTAPLRAGLILAVLFAVVPARLSASTSEIRPLPSKCVVLLTPALSIYDIDPHTMPNAGKLLQRGALGLMNTRVATGRRRGIPMPETDETTADPVRGGAYLTLGAGTRCYGGPLAPEAMARDERDWEGLAADVYKRRNAAKPPPGEMLHPNIRVLQALNTGLGYRAKPGCLAELLASVGVCTAVVGSADRPGEIMRDGALAAMLPSGSVPLGIVRGVCVPDSAEPFGLRDSVEALVEATASVLERCSKSKGCVVFVDWGDSARLNDYQSRMTPIAAEKAKARMLKRLDILLGRLSGIAQPPISNRNHGALKLDFDRDFFVWLSPHASRRGRAVQDTLAPIVIVGPGYTGGRLLTSASTRRPGIVANTDFAPTIAGWFGAGRDQTMVGRPIELSKNSLSGGSLDELKAFYTNLSARDYLRRVSMSYLLRLMQVLMFAFAVLWISGLSNAVSRGFGGSAATAVLFVPLAMPAATLMLASAPVLSAKTPLSQLAATATSSAAHGSALCALMLGLSLLAVYISKRMLGISGPLALSALTVLLVVFDGVRGFPNLPFCVFGYSILDGSRYYGIGNEMMGAFVTSTLVAGAGGFYWLKAESSPRGKAWARRLAVLLYALATAVLIVPAWGAKFGGALTAGIGFTIAAAWAYGYPIRGRTVAVCLLAAVLAVALMVALDVARGGQGSHVGMLYRAVLEGGPSEILLVAQRKFGMNIRLLIYSPWSRLLGLCVLAIISFCFDGWRRRRHPMWPNGPLGQALKASLVAAAVAFVVDDAGVLAAATALVLIPPILWASALPDASREAVRPGR